MTDPYEARLRLPALSCLRKWICQVVPLIGEVKGQLALTKSAMMLYAEDPGSYSTCLPVFYLNYR